MRATVIGCGYLGATHGACLAELGFDVLGVDIDRLKLARLATGDMPFYEPGLEDLVKRHVASGALRFTSSFEEAAKFADIHYICVGTPQRADGLGADISQVEAAVRLLGQHLAGPALVVGKSTVPVGTAERLQALLHDVSPAGESAELAWNPEFIREGFAVQDRLEPDRLVFGVTSAKAEQMLRDAYRVPIEAGTPVVVTDYATAELAKAAANAFLATKISFINAIAEVCDVAGADVAMLADALGHDARIGRRFLDAGIGYGGGCLPKDVRAFQHRAGELGADHLTSLLREVDSINLSRRQRVVSMIEELHGSVAGMRLGVLGAAFKPHSDDVRDSPALWVAGQLHLRGADVTIYDPKAVDNARTLFPTFRYAGSALEACADADVVAHLTEWPEFRDLTPAALGPVVRHARILDGRNSLDPAPWRDAGWTFRRMGRP
jgi:UDPglucose 6-dehydrogenase